MHNNIPNKDLINRINTLIGQLQGIIKMLDNEGNPEKILHQFNAAEKALSSSKDYLINDIYRKDLASKLSTAIESCPGNCGQEDLISQMKKDFPNLNKDEVIQSINDIEHSLKIINNC